MKVAQNMKRPPAGENDVPQKKQKNVKETHVKETQNKTKKPATATVTGAERPVTSTEKNVPKPGNDESKCLEVSLSAISSSERPRDKLSSAGDSTSLVQEIIQLFMASNRALPM